MRAFLAVSGLMLLLSAGPASAGPAVSLPPEVKGGPSDFIEVPATTDGKEVRWVSFDASLRVFPPALLKDTKTAVVIARGPGRFKLLAYTAIGDVPSEPAFTVIVVGDPGPAPVPPGPTPPVPPDPFVTTLQAAYGADGDPDKAKHKASLAALYRQGAELAGQPAVATWGDLFGAMVKAAEILGAKGKLAGVQSLLQSRLQAALPKEQTKPLDAPGRELAAKTFREVAGFLEAIK